MSEQRSSPNRSVRLGQVLAPFGVGAIYDHQGESLIACDTNTWPEKLVSVDSFRLSSALGVKMLKQPGATASRPGASLPALKYERFPRWLFCTRCRRLRQYKSWGGPRTGCECSGSSQVVPMRFVVICEGGHMGDVDWHAWAHRHAGPACRDRENLEFRTRVGSGSGLSSLVVKCLTCSAESDLDGITSAAARRSAARTCPGRQPWQRPGEAISCGKDPRVVQRGATNVYFAEVESALEIPEAASEQGVQSVGAIRDHDDFPNFVDLVRKGNDDGARFLGESIARSLGCPIEDVMCAVPDEGSARAGTAQPPASATGDGRLRLRDDEWVAFTGPTEPVEEPDFIIEPTALMAGSDDVIPAHRLLGELIPKVILAKRIREVRALVGFRRYSPSGQLVRPDLSSRPDWLPAIQVYGEGVFITLNEQRIAAWESESAVKDRAARIEKHRGDALLPQRLLESATPRFIVLHTLAHLLIRRLSFDSGYAAASLRERVYCREAGDPAGPQAGILVYTAAGDIEGTMGGLVRQGRPDRLVDTLTHAITDAVMCSSDPICRESHGQGYQSLNLAACHACSLLAETSCDHGNIALDRVLVTGDGTDVPGLFQEVADLAIDAVTGLGGS